MLIDELRGAAPTYDGARRTPRPVLGAARRRRDFGVVTSFEFALHPVGPNVTAGPVFWAADDTADVLRFYRDFVADAPDELGTVLRLGTVPPLPVISTDLHWRRAIAVSCCYTGAVEDGEHAVEVLRQYGTPPLARARLLHTCRSGASCVQVRSTALARNMVTPTAPIARAPLISSSTTNQENAVTPVAR